ncbi:RNA methyltransferase [Treponema sp.]|uniref:RNA methyltransferase n=1 Tax=Treponema sp. TaxID=166 RepID=UPI003F0265D0
MNLDNIVIVLARPEEPRNIGAVCRAMANSGIHQLRIVGKKEDIDIEKVHVLAIHASYIFDQAGFFSSITEACADCACICGTTRRRGKKRKGKLLLPEEFAETASRISGSESAGGKVAVVFGNERTGLDDKEILECEIGVAIPSSEEFGSLNLSHAVQIICYTLFRHSGKTSTGYTPIQNQRLMQTVNTIADNLQKIGFFSVAGRSDMEIFWRDILARAALSEGEAKYIEKVFNKAAGLARKK